MPGPGWPNNTATGKGFWWGTVAEYYDLYAHAARAVKAVSPRLRVGGPATDCCAAWITEFRECVGPPLRVYSAAFVNISFYFMLRALPSDERSESNPCCCTNRCRVQIICELKCSFHNCISIFYHNAHNLTYDIFCSGTARKMMFL